MKGGWNWIHGPKSPIGHQLSSTCRTLACAILGLSHQSSHPRCARCTPKQQVALFARGHGGARSTLQGGARYPTRLPCTSGGASRRCKYSSPESSLTLWLWLELLKRAVSTTGSTFHRLVPALRHSSYATGKFHASNNLRTRPGWLIGLIQQLELHGYLLASFNSHPSLQRVRDNHCSVDLAATTHEAIPTNPAAIHTLPLQD